jgi:ATP-binding cassette subfamily B protein
MPLNDSSACTEIESLTRFRGKPFLFFLKIARTHVWVYIVSAVLQISEGLFSLIPTFLTALIAIWISQGVDAFALISLGALIVLSNTIAAYLGNFFIFMDGVRRPYVARGARELQLRYTLYNSYDFFTRSLSGKTASRINQIGDSLNALVWNCQCVFGIGAVRIIIAGGILFAIKPIIALIFLLWAFGYYFCMFRQTLVIRRANTHLSERQSTASGQIVDTLGNFATLFNLGGHENEIKRAMRYINREAATEYAATKRELTMQTNRSGWNAFLGISYMIAAGSLSISHSLQLSQIVLIFGLWSYCTEIGWLTWAIANIAWHHARAKEQLEGLLEPYTVLESKNPQAISARPVSVEFQKVSFVYPKTAGIFKELDLVVHPQQHLGIVGRSGAGKSTLVNLILRLYDPQEGKILVNGIDLKEASFESLRDLVAVVPQDPTLFHRSIIENVLFAKPKATREQVEQACRSAHAHEFIASLPKGYDTLVGERGVKLSVGQRQRVAIARAILKDTPLVILDEATSALDSESEALIQDAFHKLFENRTVIAIAHRLSTLKQMDRIVVMDSGRIIQDGLPSALQVQDGVFKRLWQLQSEGFIGDVSQPPFVTETA